MVVQELEGDLARTVSFPPSGSCYIAYDSGLSVLPCPTSPRYHRRRYDHPQLCQTARTQKSTLEIARTRMDIQAVE